MSLSQYLKTRNLSFDPLPIGEKRKLTDEQLTRVTRISEEDLITLIQPRLDSIFDELVEKALPEEVLVLRQAIVEIGGLIDDHRAYRKEMERRKEEDDKKQTEENPTPQPEPSPPTVEEGQEGSL